MSMKTMLARSGAELVVPPADTTEVIGREPATKPVGKPRSPPTTRHGA
jgi:hypothetical protein